MQTSRSATARSAHVVPTFLPRSTVAVSVVVAVGYLLLRTTGILGLRAIVPDAPVPILIIAGSMVAAALLHAATVGGRRSLALGVAFGSGVFLSLQGFIHAMGLDVEGAVLLLAGLTAMAGGAIAIGRSSARRTAWLFAIAASAVGLVALWLVISVVNSSA